MNIWTWLYEFFGWTIIVSGLFCIAGLFIKDRRKSCRTFFLGLSVFVPAMVGKTWLLGISLRGLEGPVLGFEEWCLIITLLFVVGYFLFIVYDTRPNHPRYRRS